MSMKMTKVNLSFRTLTDADFEQKSAYILDCMTGNAHFTSPSPALAAVDTALTAYSAALLAAASLDRIAVAEKNQSRLLLEGLLARLGMYVMNVAMGNNAQLVSSGFTIARQLEPIVLANPGNVTIANGNTSGEALVAVSAVKGAKSYLHQICFEQPGDNTSWQSTYSTRCSYTYSDLQPGRQFWVRVAAVGSRAQVTYSNIATQFAQ
jgi:hypothetical protein